APRRFDHSPDDQPHRTGVRDPSAAHAEQGSLRRVQSPDAEEPGGRPAFDPDDHVERPARRDVRRRHRDPLRVPRLRQHRHPLDRPPGPRLAL
ncbi:MAG: hypothetical protein AVDCRST_MAG90-1304, partial [uncultured Microvirga sp.]